MGIWNWGVCDCHKWMTIATLSPHETFKWSSLLLAPCIVAPLYMLFTTTAASIYSVSTWDSLEECDKYSFRDALHLVTSTCFFVRRLLSYVYYLCSDSSANYLFYLIQIIHSVLSTNMVTKTIMNQNIFYMHVSQH